MYPLVNDYRIYENCVNTNNPVKIKCCLEIFAALILNGAILAYHTVSLPKKKWNVLSVIHPSIPIFLISLTVALATQTVFAMLNKKNELISFLSEKIARIATVNALHLICSAFLIHEMGHAFFAKLLFKNSSPGITIFPFQGGHTTYAISYGLTRYGLKLGREKAILLIAAGGMMASALFGLALKSAAKRINKISSSLAEILQALAISQIFSEIIYALSSLLQKNVTLENDFTYLYLAGNIHPIIPTATLSAYFIYLAQSLS